MERWTRAIVGMMVLACLVNAIWVPTVARSAGHSAPNTQGLLSGEWGGQSHSHDIARNKHNSFAVFVDFERRIVRSGHSINRGRITQLTDEAITVDFPQSGSLQGKYRISNNVLQMEGTFTTYSDGRKITVVWELTLQQPEPPPQQASPALPSGEWGGQAHSHDIARNKRNSLAVFVDFDRRIVRSGHSINRGRITQLTDEAITVAFPQSGSLQGKYRISNNVLQMEGTLTTYSDGRKITVVWELTPE